MKHRNSRRSLIAFSLVVALVVALAALTARVSPARAGTIVQLDGVKTTLTTDPGTTRALLRNLILPLPVGPTGTQLCLFCGPTVTYSFPITGGAVDADTLAGQVEHSGGLRFFSLRTFRSLTLTGFTIEIGAHPDLTAEVNGDPQMRVAILDLDLSSAQIVKSLPYVTVANVGARLTAAAAAALNATLGTTLFQPGLKLGTATVYARVAT
ncbi:MAG TPA: HtaA domain-containing protein [Gaiellaceae bacterium]|nr:HtaA domain-containing protein [Gaiellaceae bacterium]